MREDPEEPTGTCTPTLTRSRGAPELSEPRDNQASILAIN